MEEIHDLSSSARPYSPPVTPQSASRPASVQSNEPEGTVVRVAVQMESGVTGDDPVFKQALAHEFKVPVATVLFKSSLRGAATYEIQAGSSEAAAKLSDSMQSHDWSQSELVLQCGMQPSAPEMSIVASFSQLQSRPGSRASEHDTAEQSKQLTQMKDELEELKERNEELEEALEIKGERDTEMVSLNEKLVELQEELDQQQDKGARANNEVIEELVEDKQQLTENKEQLQQQLDRCQQELKELTENKEQLQQQLDSCQQELKDERRELKDVQRDSVSRYASYSATVQYHILRLYNIIILCLISCELVYFRRRALTCIFGIHQIFQYSLHLAADVSAVVTLTKCCCDCADQMMKPQS